MGVNLRRRSRTSRGQHSTPIHTLGDELEILEEPESECDPGSLRLNLDTGAWSDAASGESGNGVVSFVAYAMDWTDDRAAFEIAKILVRPDA